MPILAWSDEYSINVAEIDEQHKKLLDHVNRLHAGVEAQIDKKDLQAIILFLAVGFIQGRQLLPARRSPCGPEHYHHHGSLIIGQFYARTIQILEGEIGCRISGLCLFFLGNKWLERWIKAESETVGWHNDKYTAKQQQHVKVMF